MGDLDTESRKVLREAFTVECQIWFSVFPPHTDHRK